MGILPGGGRWAGDRATGARPGCSTITQSASPCATPSPGLVLGAWVGGIWKPWLAKEWINQLQMQGRDQLGSGPIMALSELQQLLCKNPGYCPLFEKIHPDRGQRLKKEAISRCMVTLLQLPNLGGFLPSVLAFLNFFLRCLSLPMHCTGSLGVTFRFCESQ